MQETDSNDKQNHYLKRLGIPSNVQALFYGTYKTDHKLGGIYFEYGEEAIEHYSFGFHLLPSVPAFWKAGVLETNIITEIIIGSSALDVIAYLSKKLNTYSKSTNLLFLACGARLYDSHLEIIRTFGKKKITLIFEDTFLGKIADIKVAAALMNQPIGFKLAEDDVIIEFKGKTIIFDTLNLSLNSFRKEFKVRISLLKTKKSKGVSFLQDQIDTAFSNKH